MLEAEHFKNIHAAIHAGHNREVALWGELQTMVGKLSDVCLVIRKKFVCIGGEVR